MRVRQAVLLCIILLLGVTPSHTQEDASPYWQIFIERNPEQLGTDRLQFINVLSGELVISDVNGERYTPLDTYLLYYDPTTRSVMTARPDGSVTPHPFIQLGAARRVDWLVSPDERLIAWTLTYDNIDGLTTVTTVSNPAGTNQNLILSDGPRNDGVRVFPVAFTTENAAIIMDSQPDGIGDLAPYRQYANLFQLSLIDGAITPLIGEPSCFCAASLRGDQLIRLSIRSDFTGFDVSLYNLATQQSQTIPSLGLVNYTQGGNILISPDGTQAVYALSQVEIGANQPTVRTVMMHVDLQTRIQRQLTEPITSYLEAIGWTEDNNAILVSIPERDGTWKIDIATGDLRRIATATFVGTIAN
ncbi:MAG: hypothetical protein WBC91_02650 [Phototrophicaceae bacterium]